MDLSVVIAIVGGLVGVLGLVVGYTRFVAQAPLEAKVNHLEGELKRKDQELTSKSAELAAKSAEVSQLRDEYASVLQDFLSYKGGRGGALIKREIDNELTLVRQAVAATESSLLVPGPLPYSRTFVFLSIYGPAAARLRKSKLPIDKGIVGRVYRTGLAHNSLDAYTDPAFSAITDRKGEHVTRSILTVPIAHHGKVIGVAQFLNKMHGEGFTTDDQQVALSAVQNLAPRVAEFLQDPANFETLGLTAAAEKGRTATVAFCDLSASSRMFDALDAAEVVDTINEYLERQAEIALAHGGAIDKYLGDGAMFVFNARRGVGDTDHVMSAMEAGVAMQRDFATLKRSWSELDLPLPAVYNRVALASGPVLLPVMGHPQFQQLTVFGDTVGRAAHLCEAAPRDRNVVLVDEDVSARAGHRFPMRALVAEESLHDLGHRRITGKVYEVDWQHAG